MTADASIMVVDSRTPDWVEKGIIPGAMIFRRLPGTQIILVSQRHAGLGKPVTATPPTSIHIALSAGASVKIRASQRHQNGPG
jgi:hypothetical protein